MINLTGDLQFILDGDGLNQTIELAMRDTRRILLDTYANGVPIGLEDITASRDNVLQHCAFIRYFPEWTQMHDHQWVLSAFRVTHGNNYDSFKAHKATILPSLGMKPDTPTTLALEVYRGLRIFLLALWSRRAILLPMNFSLPNTKFKGEIAWPLYTEVLAICRKPFVPQIIDSPDISAYIKPNMKRNFDWFFWRPIIASDWHTVEDITTADASALFEELALRRREDSDPNRPAYIVTPFPLLHPIKSVAPDRFSCNIEHVNTHNPLRLRKPDQLQDEVEATDDESYGEIRAVWVEYQARYLKQLKEVKRVKSIKTSETPIGHLNRYLFSVLPQHRHDPPTPIQFGRKYLEGAGVPPLRDVISRRDWMGAIERFFDFLEDIAPFEKPLEGFVNPIIHLDKQREKRPRKTTKSVFRINDFRLIRKLALAVAEFSWHVARTIGKDEASEEWREILNDNNMWPVLDAEQFGFAPEFSYELVSGEVRTVKLKWIPRSLLAINFVETNSRRGWTALPMLHNIHQTLIGLETGLRNIHIRWLDKHNYLSEPVDEHGCDFLLNVNTDKVTGAWDRVCSKEVLTAIERQIESQTWIRSDHFETELPYDDHEQSDFGYICPIFMQYHEPKSATWEMMSRYYRNFVYFFNITKVSLGDSPVEPLPEGVANLRFDCLADHEFAHRKRKDFRTTFTPHGTRATVVSSYAPILPPHIIGQEVSGHVNESMVLYYTKIDSSHFEPIRQMNREMAEQKEQHRDLVSLKAERSDSALNRAVAETRIEDVLTDFGACSTSVETTKGEIVSGLRELREAGAEGVKAHPTHICPLNDNCPADVVKSVGAKSCGQCPYSVKTVDHLPRILAHSRSLARQIDHTKGQLAEADKAGASDEALEEVENRLMQLASEVSAWTLTARALAEKCKELKSRPLMNSPEILAEAIDVAQPASGLENLMIQCEEAASYPELADSALHADVARLRARLLAMSGSLEELFVPLEGRELLDNFRGLVRGICMTTGITPKELTDVMDKPIKDASSVLKALERIHA